MIGPLLTESSIIESSIIESLKTPIPKRIFIVPYRNRSQHKFFFSKYMSFILEDKDDYEIYFSHQCDSQNFNRGATKNIGFIAARNKYPNHYKDITFIFNDVDTIPFNKIFDYETNHGIVKHYYGFKHALGGIVVIKGGDFEKINGFPCFWGWGMEDNVLQTRCNKLGLIIDRSHFYNIGSPEILQLFDGISRIISKNDPLRGDMDNGVDGLTTINSLNYTINDKSDNPEDNIFAVHNPKIMVINISSFLTNVPFGIEEFYNYDLREPKRKIMNPDKNKETRKTVVSPKDWSNIPHFPTNREKRLNIAKHIISLGKIIPPDFLRQLEEDKRKDIEEDAFNNFSSKNTQNEINEQQTHHNNNQQYHRVYQQNNYQQQHQQPNNVLRVPTRPQAVPNKYSPQYAAYVGAKPRSQASARISMGGAF